MIQVIEEQIREKTRIVARDERGNVRDAFTKLFEKALVNADKYKRIELLAVIYLLKQGENIEIDFEDLYNTMVDDCVAIEEEKSLTI